MPDTEVFGPVPRAELTMPLDMVGKKPVDPKLLEAISNETTGAVAKVLPQEGIEVDDMLTELNS